MSRSGALLGACAALLLFAGCGSSPEPSRGGFDDRYKPAPGYSWVNRDDPEDFRAVWTPGLPHRNHPNVVASKTKGEFEPAPGYRWLEPSRGPNDYRVVWDPGARHPDHPLVYAGAVPGEWKVDEGYRWANPDDPEDLTVVPVE